MSGTPSTPPQGPSGLGNRPAVSRTWLQRMVTTLEPRGQLSHVVWAEALYQMRELLLVPEDVSAFTALHILTVARNACHKDVKHFEDFIHQAEANQMLLLNNERPVSSWLAQCMPRMIGFDTSHEDDSQWWITSGTSNLVEDFHEEAYIRIHFARYRFIQAQGTYDVIGDFDEGRELALKGIHHMKAFVHLHQNRRVLARVWTHIVQLQMVIEENGLEGFLPSSY
ncbi:hypothetical protein CEP54_008874 [Fusarium duplospermum]|uniref:Uncharacterized protein n=1 Tax=Fusarium duplospermum TaxID=1325734 RepID=A0A428PTH4_9HYPO|nr:hypothetical protein CEP54_008874 [Fusarium duplospermum]